MLLYYIAKWWEIFSMDKRDWKEKKGKKEARQEEEETKEQVGEHTVYNID